MKPMRAAICARMEFGAFSINAFRAAGRAGASQDCGTFADRCTIFFSG